MKDGSKVSSGSSLLIDPAFGITISEHGQYLSVASAQLSHTGDYTCRAINDAGDDSKKYIVNVRGLCSNSLLYICGTLSLFELLNICVLQYHLSLVLTKAPLVILQLTSTHQLWFAAMPTESQLQGLLGLKVSTYVRMTFIVTRKCIVFLESLVSWSSA